jgi:hypothetical protein
MHQQVKDRLAKAALAEISHSKWEMLDEQQQHQMYELVERFAEALQSSALVNALARTTMEHTSVEPGSLLDQAKVPKDQIIYGLLSALLAHGNRSRWRR